MGSRGCDHHTCYESIPGCPVLKTFSHYPSQSRTIVLDVCRGLVDCAPVDVDFLSHGLQTIGRSVALWTAATVEFEGISCRGQRLQWPLPLLAFA